MSPPSRDRSDGELLRLTATDGDAFGELYDRYEVLVAAFFRRRGQDVDEAADLTSETFATALVNAARFRDDGPAAGWLLGIARNLLLQKLRRGRVDARARRRLGVDPVPHPDLDYERVEAVLDAAALADRLHDALSALSPTQREAVTAYVLDELSYEQLADRLGVSEATVRQRVSRGLSRMRTSIPGAP